MKTINFIAGAIVLLLCSCGDSVFVKHTLEAEKIGSCAVANTSIKMESNINGERYIFEECLPANFNTDQCKVIRKGDSLLVDLPTAAQPGNVLYRLTLDVEANPPYHHIVLGTHDAIIIVPATKF